VEGARTKLGLVQIRCQPMEAAARRMRFVRVFPFALPFRHDPERIGLQEGNECLCSL